MFRSWILTVLLQFTGVSALKSKAPSLSSLCLGVIGKHLEEMIPCLGDISVIFPADIKVIFSPPVFSSFKLYWQWPLKSFCLFSTMPLLIEGILICNRCLLQPLLEEESFLMMM